MLVRYFFLAVALCSLSSIACAKPRPVVGDGACCRESVVRTDQLVSKVTKKYKGIAFHVFATANQKKDKDFNRYASSVASALKREYGAHYTPDPFSAGLHIYLHYDSAPLPFVIDKLDNSGGYVPQFCRYGSSDSRVVRHSFFVDVVDARSGELVFSGRSIAESILAFKYVAWCIIDSTFYDTGHAHSGRVSLCSCDAV